MNILERFETKYIPEPNTGCWLWTAGCGRGGYGKFCFKKPLGMSAHRASWTLYKGNIPSGAWVLHKCDTPICVNPDHLFLGTAQSNADDCANKGRVPRGIQKTNAKLSESDVLEIRQSKLSRLSLARKFGVHHDYILMVQARKKWKHLP